MVFLESALDSKFNPLVALGKTGTMGLSGFVNKFNQEAELLDDLVCLEFYSCLFVEGRNSWIIVWNVSRTIIGLLGVTRSVSASFSKPNT